MYLCYAESDEGLSWTKPELNLLKMKEYGPNNIVVVDSGFIGGQSTEIEDDRVRVPGLCCCLALRDRCSVSNWGIVQVTTSCSKC